jgi:hypothetical protein
MGVARKPSRCDDRINASHLDLRAPHTPESLGVGQEQGHCHRSFGETGAHHLCVFPIKMSQDEESTHRGDQLRFCIRTRCFDASLDGRSRPNASDAPRRATRRLSEVAWRNERDDKLKKKKHAFQRAIRWQTRQ